jgi:hypothetical protein
LCALTNVLKDIVKSFVNIFPLSADIIALLVMPQNDVFPYIGAYFILGKH